MAELSEQRLEERQRLGLNPGRAFRVYRDGSHVNDKPGGGVDSNVPGLYHARGT